MATKGRTALLREGPKPALDIRRSVIFFWQGRRGKTAARNVRGGTA
jgi:hypothetical protein